MTSVANRSPDTPQWSPSEPSSLLLSSSMPKLPPPKTLTDADDNCARIILLSRTRSGADGPLRAKLHLALVGSVVHVNDDFGEFRILCLKTDDGADLDQCRISARTQLFIAYTKYNIVVAVDVSSSTATASSHSVLFDESVACVVRLLSILYSLRSSFRSVLSISEPSIFVSIIACDHANIVQTIVHNADLETNDLPLLIDLCQSRFSVLERQLSSSPKNDDSTINDSAFMMACALLTHDRMPLERCPITFLVTDGVQSAPDIGTFDSVFVSVAAKDILLHTVLLSTPTSYFGFVPDPDFLEMTAQFSGGMSISSDQLLCGVDTFERHILLLLLPSAITRTNAPISAPPSRFCLKLKEYLVDVGVGALLACRIKEGFKGGRLTYLEPSGFTISLVLVWKPIITVEYIVEMRDQQNPRVVLKVIAPDEFLRRLQVLQKSKKHRVPLLSVNTGAPVMPHPLFLLERVAMIVKTDQLLVLLHCIRPSDVMLGPTQVRLALEPNQGSSCLAKLISLPPTIWKRWMTVFSLDIVDQRSHPNDQLGAGSESLIDLTLRKWCSSVHGKVYIKQLADYDDSLTDDRLRSSYWRAGHRRPLRLCFARLFWITNGLAYLCMGFTTVDAFQIESELQLLKSLLQNHSSIDRSQESCVVFPLLPLSSVLLRLDPTDDFFCSERALNNASARHSASLASPQISPPNSISLSRSASTPDLKTLGQVQIEIASPKLSSSPSPAMRSDFGCESVQTLPKAVLRFFMHSCQRSYRIQNFRTLSAFFQRLNHSRISDGFRRISSDKFSCSYFTEIEIIADRRANLQFALCKHSETDVYLEIWLDPDEPSSSRSPSVAETVDSTDYFNNIVNWLDIYDCHCLQALQAFHAIVDAGMNPAAQPFSINDGNSIYQYKSQPRLSGSPMSGFSVREIPFDIVPLLHCARPCVVPLRFPTGMPANQTSIISSLERIHGLIPVLSEICYAQIISHAFITLVVLSPEAGSVAARQTSELLRSFIDSVTGVSSDVGPNTTTVIIFEVNMTDISQYCLPIKSPLTDLNPSFTPVFVAEPRRIEKRSCSHSSELVHRYNGGFIALTSGQNNLRQKIEQAHAANFVRAIYENAMKGEHVSHEDLRTTLHSCVQFRHSIDMSEFADVGEMRSFQDAVQRILKLSFRVVSTGLPYFALIHEALISDGMISDEDLEEDASIDSSNNPVPAIARCDTAEIATLPFFCLFEIVNRTNSSKSDTIIPLTLPVDLPSTFAPDSTQIFMRLTVFMLPSNQAVASTSRTDLESKSRIRKTMSLSSFPRSPALLSTFSRNNAQVPEFHRFSSLPQPFQKYMARMSKLIRVAFCHQMLRRLYVQLPRPLSEKEASSVIKYLDYLRQPLKQELRIELEFVQCAGVARSPRSLLVKLLREQLTLQKVTSSCFLVAIDSFAFLSISSNNVSVVVHERGGALSHLENIILGCLHRVNQLMLLESLHVTRIASPLLISDDEAKFGCPRLFAEELKLHPRLIPTAALQTLNDTTLHPFVLGNRNFVYVYQQSNGAIFYMRLLLHGASLFFEFYGADKPDPDTCSHVSNLLRSSISALALAQIAALLSRNQHFRWTQADLLLIRSEGSAPNAAFRFQLPFAVRRKVFSFLLRMAQTFSSSSMLSALRCADSGAHTERFHWNWSDFSFVYNYDAQFSSSKLVDNGIALIFGSLISIDDGILNVHLICADEPDVTELNIEGINFNIKLIKIAAVSGGVSRMEYVAESHCQPTSDALSIAFEIWASGFVDVHQLVSDISRIFSHTIHDFLLESLWTSIYSESWPSFQQLEALRNLALTTHSEQNPALHLTNVSLSLTSWSIPSIVEDLGAMICSIHEHVQVSISVCDSGIWRVLDWPRTEDYRISRARLLATAPKLSSFQYHPHVSAGDAPFSNSYASKNSVLVERIAFVLVEVSRTDMQIIAYNFRTSLALQLMKQSLKLVSWCGFRIHLLDHILHQKLGLFKHISALSPPVTSTDNAAAQPAKFTVENIEVLVINKAPPRHVIHESTHMISEPRHNPGSLTDRRRTLNRFETPRSRFISARSPATVLSSGSSAPSAYQFSTLLWGQTPPSEYIGFSKRAAITDPVSRHGQSYILISKRIREEKELELQKKFCLDICDSGVAPVASFLTQFQWIELILSYAIPLSNPICYVPPSFLFRDASIEFLSSAMDMFVSEFESYLAEFSFHSLIVFKHDFGHGVVHRCLFRKMFSPGLFSAVASKICCDGYLYESLSGSASAEQFKAASAMFNQNIDATAFTLRFHVLYLFSLLTNPWPQSSHQSALDCIDLYSTCKDLCELTASGLICRSLHVDDSDTFKFLSNNAGKFGYHSFSGYIFNKDFIAFSLQKIFIRDETLSSTLISLQSVCENCQGRIIQQRLWEKLTVRSSNTSLDISESDLLLLGAKELHEIDPVLQRLFNCLGKVDPLLVMGHFRRTFPNMYTDLRFQSGSEIGIFIGRDDVGLVVIQRNPACFLSCSICDDVQAHRRALYIDVVNAASLFLWRKLLG